MMKKTILIKVLIFFLLGSMDAMAQQDTVKLKDVKYGGFERNLMDVYLPPGRTPKTPFVILIHGGAWVQAGKEYVRDFQQYLLSQGIASVNINHRYANDSTIHYKQIMEDVDRAVKYCADHAGEWNTRTDGFGTAGFSSGAHLALLYGYTTQRKINAIVDFSGPNNFTDTATLNYCVKAGLIGLVEKITGDRFTGVSHVPASFSLASPYTHVKNIPTFIAHGTIDPVVKVIQSQQLAQKLQRMHVPVKFIEVEGLAHDLDKKPQEKLKLYQAAAVWLKKYGQKR
jgi:acetyl esterase/lipase